MNEKLYHQVPKHMKGDELLPLSSLKDIDSALHEEHLKKYKGREELLEEVIPNLNCSRKDLIYLTAVHPSFIKEALEKCGRTEPFNSEYFEIDPNNLDLDKTIVDLNDKFEKFETNNLSKYKDTPKETLDYYKEEFAKGQHPFIHHKIPQILYKGKIDVSNAKKIKI